MLYPKLVLMAVFWSGVFQAARTRPAGEHAEIFGERDGAVIGEHVRAHRVVAHRQHACGDAQVATEIERDLRQAPAGSQPLRAQQRRGERFVAEQRLLGTAERLQHAVQQTRLARGLPAGLGAGHAGKRVDRGVEIG